MEGKAAGARRKKHSLTFDESRWNLIRGRAEAAGMSVSEFVGERALKPERPLEEEADLPVAVWRRAVVDLRTLVLVEQLRFEQEGVGATWRRLVEEAEASVAADEAAS